MRTCFSAEKKLIEVSHDFISISEAQNFQQFRLILFGLQIIFEGGALRQKTLIV